MSIFHPMGKIPKSAPRPCDFRGGFTLMELIIVIVMIAILMAIATPSFVGWNANRRLMSQAREVYSQMQLAKMAAIRNDCDVAVSFNTAKNSYQVFLDNGGPARTVTAVGDGILDAGESVIASGGTSNDVYIAAAQFGAAATPIAEFTGRALPLNGNIGNVAFGRIGRTDRWYRVQLLPSGQVTFQTSVDSTNGQDGNWK